MDIGRTPQRRQENIVYGISGKKKYIKVFIVSIWKVNGGNYHVCKLYRKIQNNGSVGGCVILGNEKLYMRGNCLELQRGQVRKGKKEEERYQKSTYRQRIDNEFKIIITEYIAGNQKQIKQAVV